MIYNKIEYKNAIVSTSLFERGRRELHAYITPSPRGDATTQIAAVNEAAHQLASDSGLSPVFKRWLLSDPTNQQPLLPDMDECASTIIGQSPLDGTKATLLLLLEENPDFTSEEQGMWIDSRGRIWAGDNNEVPTSAPLVMTVEYLERLAACLKKKGGNLKENCIRTWFFVRDIDNNYPGVVHGRNGVFAREGLSRDTHFIASTGIEGKSSDPSRPVSFNAFADLNVTPQQVTQLYGATHLNPTYEYGVAFERGTAVDYSDRRHVYISGTASIDNKGRIVAPGNITAQTLRMLENISVLLHEAGCGFEDVGHLTIYIRDIADLSTVKEIIHRHFPDIPKAIVLASVCRPGWLVEAECMAIRKADNPAFNPY